MAIFPRGRTRGACSTSGAGQEVPAIVLAMVYPEISYGTDIDLELSPRLAMEQSFITSKIDVSSIRSGTDGSCHSLMGRSTLAYAPWPGVLFRSQSPLSIRNPHHDVALEPFPTIAAGSYCGFRLDLSAAHVEMGSNCFATRLHVEEDASSPECLENNVAHWPSVR